MAKSKEKSKEQRGRGRPPRGGTQPVRQVGRWDDATWNEIREEAAASNTTVAEWAKVTLLRAARRSKRLRKSKGYRQFVANLH